MEMKKFQKHFPVTATIHLKSGLHIGTGEKDVEKGEPTPIIKSKHTGLPYIPGSSIKGKIRCMLEMKYGRSENGNPCSCGKCSVCVLFGSGSANKTFEPTRLLFRDCQLSEKSRELTEKLGLETKPGVRIDRNTGKAAQGALFPAERVPEGTEFDMVISARVFENDNVDALKKWLMVGMLLMEGDAIGSSGSRGSGWIEFRDVKMNGVEVSNWREEAKKVMDSLMTEAVSRDSKED